eukprot:5217447-Amphidinium_carterae.1
MQDIPQSCHTAQHLASRCTTSGRGVPGVPGTGVLGAPPFRPQASMAISGMLPRTLVTDASLL